MAVVSSTRSNIQLRLKEGDLLPVLDFQAEQQDYTRVRSAQRVSQQVVRAADLTGATAVVFVWRLRTSAKATANSAAAIFVEKKNGDLRYVWEAGDTDTPGRYYGEFVVIFPTGEQTFPAKGHIKFTIESDLDT